jgi:6-pyruvoyltetrahydropterin/6-carboxytetrahydropterin synthase
VSFVVEVDCRVRARPGLSSPVRARNGRSLLAPGAAIDITVTVGVAFQDDQLDHLGRYFDTDAAAEQLDRACADLSGRPWTELFDFRPTFELVARHLFDRLAPHLPQLAFVQLHDESFGSRTRYLRNP